MKQLLSIIVFSFFISNVSADDWRMEKFDLNKDNLISQGELLQRGCVKTMKMFNRADKNGDGVLNKREARNATYIIFKNRRVCPVVLKPVESVRG
jgi:hypothetical protein|tara:strand:+ start:222 stop:506 length:285 start_codon:yes stop_codon:yes gene_type:complete